MGVDEEGRSPSKLRVICTTALQVRDGISNRAHFKQRGSSMDNFGAIENISYRAISISTRYILATIFALSFILQPGSFTYAQESGINALMEEIKVTARKREEGLQDTPIAVSVFSGESLEARGVPEGR